MPVLNVPYRNLADKDDAPTAGVAWAGSFTLTLWDRTPGGSIAIEHFANPTAFVAQGVETRRVDVVPRPGKIQEFFAANPDAWNAIQAFLDEEIQAYFGEGDVTQPSGPPEWATVAAEPESQPQP